MFFLARQILIEYKSLVVYSTQLYIKSLHSIVDSRIEGEVPFPRNQEHHHNYFPPILASNKSLTYFLAQLNNLKNYYCHGKNIRANNLFIMPLFDETLLEQQTSFSTVTTMSNVVIVMKLPIYYNSCYWMWALLTNDQIISHKLLKWLKLIKSLLWLQLLWGSSRMKGVSLHCSSQRTNWETRSKPINIWLCRCMHKIFILCKVFHFLSWPKYECQRKLKGQQDKSQFFLDKYINFLNSLSCIVNFCDFLCLTFHFKYVPFLYDMCWQIVCTFQFCFVSLTCYYLCSMSL